MVCPDKKPKGKFQIVYDGEVMGEIEPYIETDEDVKFRNRQDAYMLLTPPKMSFTAIVFNRLETIRGFYAVRPLIR